MKLELAPALDRLAADLRCLGAVFTSFTFDAAFFEQHVLAAVLRLTSDPETAAAAFHDEAVAALQDTPVVCFVDATMRPPGHRLPFDLREIRGRVFHPKLALVLYEPFARLSIASGNLTEPGYGGNAETFFVYDLAYDKPEHAAVLREVAAFVRAIDAIAAPGGAQTQLVLDALARRVEDTAPSDNVPFAFVHSEATTPLLDRLLALIPEQAKIDRVGILAPCCERDDVSVEVGDDAASVVLALAKRAGKHAVLDLGVSWDDPPLAKSAADTIAIADRLDVLWAVRRLEGATMVVRYFVPQKATPSSYKLVDHEGRSRTVPKVDYDDLVARGEAWPVGLPQVFAPRAVIAAAREVLAGSHVWLHPRRTLAGTRTVERPLHAKLLSITFTASGKTRTLVVVGSANASRMAYLKTPAQHGNVEACVAFLVDGEELLHDLTPGLNHCASRVDWRERQLPALPPMPAVPIVESAIYDARAERLTVTWAPAAQPPIAIAAWSLAYQTDSLARGDGPPTAPTVIAPFRLSAACCEIVVRAADGERATPILVDDLAALPLGTAAAPLDLRAMLAMLGRHLSAERFKTIAERHGRAMVDATLESLLGERFAPTDVFRAWAAAAANLGSDGLSVSGFRLRLLGAIGPAAAWTRMRELAGTPALRAEEAWFYGAELRRTLRLLAIPAGPDHTAKAAVLVAFLAQLSTELSAIAPSSSRAWVQRIVQFYEGTSS